MDSHPAGRHHCIEPVRHGSRYGNDLRAADDVAPIARDRVERLGALDIDRNSETLRADHAQVVARRAVAARVEEPYE